MKYQIEVNETIEAEAGTRDMALFIANTISEYWKHTNNPKKVVVYKEGEKVFTF